MDNASGKNLVVRERTLALGLMLVLMIVHKPFIELGLFSLKPFMIGMILVFGLLVLDMLAKEAGPLNFRIPPFILPMAAFVALALISGLFAKNVMRSLVLTVAVMVGVAFYWLLYILVLSVSHKRILILICLAGIITGLVSVTLYVFELIGFLPGIDFVFYGNPNMGEFSGAGRMIGLNNDPNIFAVNVSFYFIISMVVLYWPDIDWKLRVMALLGSFLTGLCIFATISRGAMFGAVIGFLISLVLSPRYGQSKFARYSWISALWVGIILVLVFYIVPPDSRNFAMERIRTVSFSEELSAGGRPALWLANIDLFMDHPLLGVGLGNTMLYPKYFVYGHTVQYAHNTFLEVLTETGFIGLIVYAGITGLILLNIWRVRLFCLNNYDVLLVTALIVANITMLIQLQFLSVLYDPVVWGLWAVTAGVVTRLKEGTARL